MGLTGNSVEFAGRRGISRAAFFSVGALASRTTTCRPVPEPIAQTQQDSKLHAALDS